MSAAGVITWVDQNSNYVATLPIRSAIFDGDLRLNYRIGKRRASEPSLQLIFRDSCMVRLDINQGHVVEQGKRHLGTHHHIRRKGPSGREEFHVGPLSLRSPVLGRRVSGTEYQSILIDFAGMYDMDIAAVEWSDPPEGRHP
ncbi:hypothetical protein MPC38_02925 [Prescottella equi]|uniref:hypothetical protein n=1 Tax=Rhodococcus hoagii TaxID=43767 RepID=UPI001F5C0233|nr:hypothetical protein [Prescottella equi]UNQ40235.1 hypothetical protein MPC38_02925 [Prescottella equi]